jgi:hypothetical protein
MPKRSADFSLLLRTEVRIPEKFLAQIAPPLLEAQARTDCILACVKGFRQVQYQGWEHLYFKRTQEKLLHQNQRDLL